LIPSTEMSIPQIRKRMIEVRTMRTIDSTFLDTVECLVVNVRVEDRLGGNTTDVQARPKGHTLLYTCSLGENESMDQV